MTKKGLWEHLEDLAPSDPSGRKGDWTISLDDLHIHLYGAGFDTPKGQLETELEQADANSDFGWTIVKRDGRYHFTAKR